VLLLPTSIQRVTNQGRHYFLRQLAITAGTPILRGMLADNDARWSIIAGSVDDRPLEERGLKPLENNHFVIPKCA
jgi:hypothetical protein